MTNSQEPVERLHRDAARLASEDVTDIYNHPEFVAAWMAMEERGFMYGEDALENVHLGYNLARYEYHLRAERAEAELARVRTVKITPYLRRNAEEWIEEGTMHHDGERALTGWAWCIEKLLAAVDGAALSTHRENGNG